MDGRITHFGNEFLILFNIMKKLYIDIPRFARKPALRLVHRSSESGEGSRGEVGTKD